MAKHRIKKYSRRTSSGKRNGKVGLIVVLVIAFMLLSCIISVAIGIALGQRAEEIETSERLDLSYEAYDSKGKTVKSIEAYHFPVEAAPSDYVYQDITDLSVAVRHEDGSLPYYLETGEKYPIDKMGERSFKALCDSAKIAGARVCAYFYVTSFNAEDEREAAIIRAYEIALISEIAKSGADDILLLGLEVTEENISELEKFVSDAAKAAEKAPLGVAVDRETVALTESEIYLAARLRSSCDYLALDLTDLEVKDGENGKDQDGKKTDSKLLTVLSDFEYYIRSYGMRIIFSQQEYKLYVPALELGVKNLQIVGK